MKPAKFSVGAMLPLGITLVVLGIALAYGLQVMGDVQDDMTADSAEYNATSDAIDGVSKFPEKLPIIAGVIVAVIIIGLLVRNLVAK